MKKNIFIVTILTVLFLVTIGVCQIVQHNQLVISFDKFFYTRINGLPHSAFIDQLLFPFGLWFLPWKIFFMPAFFYFLFFPFIFYMYGKKRSTFFQSLITLAISLLIAGIYLILLTKFSYRERPFMHLPVKDLSASAKSILIHVTSFPSGHTRDTMIFAIVISYFIPSLKIPLILFACFIAFARVYSGEHYPSDVLFGLFLGYVIARVAIYLVMQVIYKRPYKDSYGKND